MDTSTRDRFLTLSHMDPEYEKHLDGRAPKGLIAIPLRSSVYSVSAHETTFELITTAELEKPSWPYILMCIIRPTNLFLSLGPLFVSLIVMLLYANHLVWWRVVLSFVGVTSFHIGMNALDDYYDYRSGRDRVRNQGGRRVLEKAWARPYQLYRGGIAALIVSILLGLPVVLMQSSVFLFWSSIALLIGCGFSGGRLGLKRRGLSEMAGFLLAGPALSSGFTAAVLMDYTRPEVWIALLLGIGFGFCTALHLHLRHLENIMADAQAGVATLATRLGFDSSKRVALLLAGLAVVALLPVLQVSFDSTSRLGSPISWIIVILIQIGFVLKLRAKLAICQSPLSSELVELSGWGLRFQALMVLTIIMALILNMLSAPLMVM